MSCLLDKQTLSTVPELVGYWSANAPEIPALVGSGLCLRYGELSQLIKIVAGQLKNAGVRPGDRLAIVGENTLSVPVLMLAAQTILAWPAIVNPRLPKLEIDGMLDCIKPRRTLYIVDAGETPRIDGSDHGVEMQRWPLPERVLATEIADTEVEPACSDQGQQVAVLIFTSGTTGMPRAVMHSHRNLLNLGAVLSASRQTRQGDQYTGATPLAHIMGMSNLMNTLWAGSSLQLLPRMEMAALVETICHGDMTHLSFVPTAYQRLLEYLETRRISVSGHRLTYISCGGAPLDPLLKSRVEAVFGLPLVNGFGMTECAPVARTRPDSNGPAGSVGWPEQGVRVRIVDFDGQSVKVGDVGELWVSSSTVMLGYYNDSRATKLAFPGPGWLATGDLARLLPDGQIEIVGRRKEMIIRSGFNVYPVEVERALNSVPGIVQSAVVGRPAEAGNEEVIAFVQLTQGSRLSAGDILAAVSQKLAPYKRPAIVNILPALPQGATGKIRKADLMPMVKGVHRHLPGR